MRRPFLILLLAALGCGGNAKQDGIVLSHDPISVRGWIADVEGSPNAPFHTAETESARKANLYQSTNVWIDGAPYISGGVAENGSFILLDVPPGNVTINFAAPGAPDAKLVLQNVPGNADVFIPALLLKRGGVELLQPAETKVRMAAKVDKPRPTGKTAILGGHPFPVIDTPMAQMTDRLDFPKPPGNSVPLATVK
jgi:hypothetical protein